jgi:hypothetical protein
MSYRSKDLFYEWHQKADAQLNNEKANQRIEAIEELLDNEEIDFWSDIVRLHYGAPVNTSQNLTSFIQAIKGKDGTFPLNDNEALVKSLASIALCFLFETDEDSFIDDISLLTLNYNFFGQYNPDAIIPVRKLAFDYHCRSLLSDREFDETECFDDVSAIDNLGAARALTTDEQTKIAKGIKSSMTTIKSLAEESNILWWVFGEHSTINDKHFQDVGLDAMVFCSAKELAQLTKFPTPILNAKYILAKVLTISNDQKQPKSKSIIEVLKGTTDERKKELLANYEISDATPLLYALKKSLEHDAATDWSGSFKKTLTNADIKKGFSYRDIAFQAYNEFVYLSQK